MKGFLVVLFLYFVPAIIYSQSTFSKHLITTDNDNTARTIIEDSNGYILNGIGHRSIFSASHIFITPLPQYWLCVEL